MKQITWPEWTGNALWLVATMALATVVALNDAFVTGFWTPLLIVLGVLGLYGLYCGFCDSGKFSAFREALVHEMKYRPFILTQAFAHPYHHVRLVGQQVLLAVLDLYVGASVLMVVACRVLNLPLSHLLASLGVGLFFVALWLINDWLDRGPVPAQ